MANLGADVEALDQLAKAFSTEAGKVKQSISTIGGKLGSAWWSGKDADKFRSEWESHYKKDLSRVAQALEDAAAKVKKEAQQQRVASGQ